MAIIDNINTHNVCFRDKLWFVIISCIKKLRGFSPRANYTDRSEVSANFRRYRGVAWSARQISPAVISIF
jgi:hypothetical protein